MGTDQLAGVMTQVAVQAAHAYVSFSSFLII